jgi:hypothetical protein
VRKMRGVCWWRVGHVVRKAGRRSVVHRVKGRLVVVAARFDRGSGTLDVRALVLVVLVAADVPAGGRWLLIAM